MSAEAGFPWFKEPRITLTDVILQTYILVIKCAANRDYESGLSILYTASRCMPSDVQDELKEDLAKIEMELAEVSKIDNNYGFVGKTMIQTRELEKKHKRLFDSFLSKFTRTLDKHHYLEKVKPAVPMGEE